MSSIRKRLTRELIERLNSAAHRHRISAAEIARRAFQKYRTACATGVVELPEREETTRENSQSMVFHGIDDGEAVQEFAGQILAWYLDNNDKGTPSSVPNLGETVPMADGGVAFVWPPKSDWRTAEDAIRT